MLDDLPNSASFRQLHITLKFLNKFGLDNCEKEFKKINIQHSKNICVSLKRRLKYPSAYIIYYIIFIYNYIFIRIGTIITLYTIIAIPQGL